MALRDAEIGVRRRKKRLFFSFRAADGPVAATAIEVIRAESAEPVDPVWSLFPAGYTVRTVSDCVTTISLESAGSGESKTRHAGAVDDGERMLAQDSVPVPTEIEYGEVPPGFQQVNPAHGPAPELQPGVRYVLMLIGACWGQVTFEA
jgi:hypothetical protein